ncbi:MAG: amino acid permease [Endomicrobium sp.]|jgi:L-asparagine transporter-like permease|nr:amino acid permease [Endomicrobium sp.]
MKQLQSSDLKRKLQNRHVQFIAFGGVIGTGLFLGTGSAIAVAGPAVILGYLFSGMIAFFIMRHLGEMDTEEPMAGSFSYFAYKYCGKFTGFLSGWNYWFLSILSIIAELTAAAAYVQYWFPTLATWKAALFFFIIINIINAVTVKAYGEIEFWFSIIKIVAISAMIITGAYVLVINPSLIDGATFKNLWMPPTVGKHIGDPTFSGFFPHGFLGFIAAIPMIIFAFDGLELVGITAAETANPQKTIPKAVNQVMSRVLIFYVGSLVILLSLYHWVNLGLTDSPFVMIFDRIGFKYAAWTLNFVILTAALSVYITCIYSNSRVLYALALQQNAPKIFMKTNKRGIPTAALMLSGILTVSVVPLNYFVPNWFEAFKIIVNFLFMYTIINWILITITHLKFKKQKNLENYKSIFPAPFYPYSNYITLVFIAFILIIVSIIPRFGMITQVMFMPVWVLLVYIGYKISKLSRNKKNKI